MSTKLQLDVRHLSQWRCHLINAYEVKVQAWLKVMAAYRQSDNLKIHLQTDCLYTGIRSGPNAQ